MWAIRVDDDLELVLAEEHLAEEVTEVVDRNRAHLAAWEAWAAWPATVEDNRAWLRSCVQGFARGEHVQTYLRADERLVGSAGLRFDAVRNVAEVGYWVDAATVGKGFATRATGALVTLAFEERKVRRVEIRASTGNVRSRAVAERLGFTHEGTLRQAYPIGDRVDDIALYGKLNAE